MKQILFILFLLIFTGCASSSQKVSELLQTDGAKLLQRDYQDICNLLIEFKRKLDVRNPNAYDKNQTYYIIEEIKNSKETLFYPHEGKYLKSYDDYLHVAFSKKNTKYRNDFLILGLYKLIYETYKKREGHQFTSLSYDEEKFKKLYYYLKVINWKIKTNKDENENYLFLTWQRNWQVELQKSKTQNIFELSSLKKSKESLLDPSNFNFEIMMHQMFFHVKNSAKIIGEEPLELSLDAMTSFVLFL